MTRTRFPIGRKNLLGLSVAVSFACYAALLIMAPRMIVMRANTAVGEVERLLQVRVRMDEPPPIEPRPAPPAPEIQSPGSVNDLLTTESLKPGESAFDTLAEIPDLSGRVASEPFVREYELKPEEAVLAKLDAKVIEIAQDMARSELEITRRLVPPSPDRILDENAMPTLRGEAEPTEDVALFPSLFGSTLSEGPMWRLPGEEGASGFESGFAASEPAGLPQLPVEDTLARTAAMEEARKQNPYEFFDDLVTIALDTYRPPDEKSGYFRLRIVPKNDKNIPVLPKDVTFVIDASDSILQRKLDETSKAVQKLIAGLRPEDRFNIVVFRDTPLQYQAQPVPASPEMKKGAVDFIQGIEATGQTDIYEAIAPIVQQDTRPDASGLVVVVTDGRPTTGVRDSRIIINDFTAENTSRNTIIAYGGGKTVNRYLLDLLAYRNKGEAYVSPEIEKIRQDLPAFVMRNNDPILIKLKADYGQVARNDVFPRELPDFCLNRPVTVYGRFDPAGDRNFVMRLTGQGGQQKKKELVFKADLQSAESGDAEIARNWAFQRIYYLIGEMCRVGETPELRDELRVLSKKHGIKTSYDE